MFFNVSDKKDSKSEYVARSVLVDSEHKVISQVVNHVRKQCKWNYDSNSQVRYQLFWAIMADLTWGIINNIISVFLYN